MFQHLIEYLQGFSWSKLFVSILLISVGAAGLVLYEAHTRSIDIQRAKASLEIAALAEAFRKEAGVKLSPAQHSIYEGALHTADSAVNVSENTIEFQHDTMKFLSGLLPWVLMAFVYIGGKSQDSYVGMFGAVIFGVPVAGVLALVPDIAWPWLNLTVLPAVPFVLILGFFAYTPRWRKQNP
jgi:hypothetical protein